MPAHLALPLLLALAAVLPADAGRDDVAALVRAAGRGQPEAQFALAEHYRTGTGVTPDMLAAEQWYGRAARWHDGAAVALALIQLDRRQPRLALPWLDRAARRGDPRAIGLLATLYINGNGIDPDPALAYGLTLRAAERLPAARAQLALLDGALAMGDKAAGAARLAAWDTAAPLALPDLPADPPTPPPSPWQAQIASFQSAPAAHAGWTMLARRMALGPDTAPLLIEADGVVRVRLPAQTAAEAHGLCRRAARARLRCFVVGA